MATKSKISKQAAPTKQAPTEQAKVTKLVRGSKQAATEQVKVTKPTKPTKQRAAVQRYAGRKIRILVKAADVPTLRGGRATRWAMVSKAKTTDDVLGVEYENSKGETVAFNASNFAPFVEKGLIAID